LRHPRQSALMKDRLTPAMQSRTGRAAGALVGATLAAFLVGYLILGPIVLRLLMSAGPCISWCRAP
jgi:hypothetical protein